MAVRMGGVELRLYNDHLYPGWCAYVGKEDVTRTIMELQNKGLVRVIWHLSEACIQIIE